MVTRPVFSPKLDGVGVEVRNSPPFTWNPGFAFSQKQKNVVALHDAIINAEDMARPLEVSSKSKIGLGAQLSAFNLGSFVNDKFYTVESVYQASKVFAGGIGPFPELYGENPAEVRSIVRERAVTKIVAYKTGDVVWDLNPTRAFYDWVYCRALRHNPVLQENLKEYNCFTDIEFNPVKSLNCQAYAVSLFLSLRENGVLEEALTSKESFLRFHPIDVVHHVETNTVETKKRRGRSSRIEDPGQMEFFDR